MCPLDMFLLKILAKVSLVYCLSCIEVWTEKRKFGRISSSQCDFVSYVTNNVDHGWREPAGRHFIWFDHHAEC